MATSHNNIVDYQPHINMVKDDLAKNIEELSKIGFYLDQKMKFKSDLSDILKLEELLVNMIEHSANLLNKKYADKLETKKGLIFLEKRV